MSKMSSRLSFELIKIDSRVGRGEGVVGSSIAPSQIGFERIEALQALQMALELAMEAGGRNEQEREKSSTGSTLSRSLIC